MQAQTTVFPVQTQVVGQTRVVPVQTFTTTQQRNVSSGVACHNINGPGINGPGGPFMTA